jgi:hypothetical protein
MTSLVGIRRSKKKRAKKKAKKVAKKKGVNLVGIKKWRKQH